jgi:hydrogenase-4 component E
MGVNLLLILVLLTNFKLLGSTRLGACISATGVQGVMLGFLPILVHEHTGFGRVVWLAVGSMVIKGIVFPRLLFRAIREADVTREVDPYIGFIQSMLLGLAALGVSFWLGNKLPLPSGVASTLLAPVSLFSILAGFMLIVGRKRAVHQVIGFLVLENGIYTFGVGVMGETSLLVELGVLLDVLVAVFVLGITIFHISREFDHIETDRLSTLKD